MESETVFQVEEKKEGDTGVFLFRDGRVKFWTPSSHRREGKRP